MNIRSGFRQINLSCFQSISTGSAIFYLILSGSTLALCLFLTKPIQAETPNTKLQQQILPVSHSYSEKTEQRVALEQLTALHKLVKSSFQQLNEPPMQQEKIPDYLLGKNCPQQQKSSKQQLKELEISHKSKDLGFNVEGGYRYSSRDLESWDYNHRFYFGVSWDVFKGGLYQNRQKAYMRRKELRISELLLEHTEGQENYLCNYNTIIAFSNRQKLALLQKKKKFLKEAIALYTRLYFLRFTNVENIIELKRELSQTKNKIDIYNKYMAVHFKTFTMDEQEKLIFSPPLIDVNLEKLVEESVDHNEIKEQIGTIRHDILERKYSKLNDLSLRLFVRENVYHRDGEFSDGVSAGVSASFPLYGFYGKKLLKKTEMEAFSLEVARERKDNLANILNTYYEFKYKLDDAINFLYKEEKIQQLLEREFLKIHFETLPTTPFESVRLIQNLFDVQFQIQEAKERLYLKMVRLASVAGVSDILPFISLPHLETDIGEVRPGERSIYIWSKSFNTLTNDYLLKLCKVKSIKEIFLSAGNKTKESKLLLFVKAARKEKIKRLQTVFI